MIQWVANLCPAQLGYFLVSTGFSPALSALPSVRAAGLGKLQLSSPFGDFSFPSRGVWPCPRSALTGFHDSDWNPARHPET